MNLYTHRWGFKNTHEQELGASGADHGSGLPKHNLLLLHGMGGTGALWRPVALSLETQWNVIAVDQRGHGKSLLTQEEQSASMHTPLDYAQDVVETLKNTPQVPTWVLGHSMGVRTALALAHLMPEWIQGLILVDLGLSGLPGGSLGARLAEFLKLLPQGFSSLSDAQAFMKLHCPDPSMAQYLLAVAHRKASGEIQFPFQHSVLIQTNASASSAPLRSWAQEAAQHRIPILFFRGAKSLVWTREDFQAEQAAFAQFPEVQFQEVEDAGHGLPFEKRVAFVEAMTRFCSRRWKTL
ncbi:MAG: alpha/beta fold hydrolase [Bdellovibrionia bacterium]